MALALARKYRPSTFTDLVGQSSVSKTLSLALDNSKLSHAYLFSGIRGSGKTSTARIFAKSLLCKSGPTSKPCQICEQCKMGNESRHIDIIEMDAASNRGIEDIKELIEHTKYKPSIGRFKVFIIDEVHMLTVQAFNALLKTLEEPPDFVKFILATTDPLKLPATILSRTQHFRFKKLPQKVVAEHLEYILNKESVEFEQEALEIVARSGQGSLRDSLTLLDQAIVYANGKIDTATVTNMLGIVDPNILNRLVESILQKDKNSILEFMEKFASFEPEMIIDELTIYLQEELLNGKGNLTTLLIDRFFRVLADGKNLLSMGSNSEFVLSLTLFKMVEALNIYEIDDVINKLQSELSTLNNIPLNSTPETLKKIKKPESEKKEIAKEVSALVKQKSKEKEIQEEDTIKEQAKEPKAEPQKSDKIDGELIFKQLVKKIYDRNYELGEVFEKNIDFISFENDKLIWETSAQEEDKKLLFAGWKYIKLFVDELFGIGTEIAPKKKLIKEEPTKDKKYEESKEIAQTNSCIMPEGKTEASKDIDLKDLLEEPMVKEFIKYFDPKKVIVKQKS